MDGFQLQHFVATVKCSGGGQRALSGSSDIIAHSVLEHTEELKRFRDQRLSIPGIVLITLHLQRDKNDPYSDKELNTVA